MAEPIAPVEPVGGDQTGESCGETAIEKMDLGGLYQAL
jgi:hypothetical protein